MSLLLVAVGVPSLAQRQPDEAGRQQAEALQSEPPPTFLAQRDQDKGGLVSLGEWLADVPDDQRAEPRWAFYQRDLDGDLWLTPEEGRADDPPADNRFVAHFKRLDADQNQTLSHAEYVDPAGEKYAEAARSEFAMYDRDEDGQLTYEEFLCTPRESRPAETRFRWLDRDQNGRLEFKEFRVQFASAHQPSNRYSFFYRDADGDLELSVEEFLAPGDKLQPHFRSHYAARDANEDGELSREEYIAPNIGGKWEEAATRESVAYDFDGDGVLSLIEFAFTPPSNTTPEQRFAILDQNGDELLDRAEFLASGPEINGASLKGEFHLRDQDDDGRLSQSEFLAAKEDLNASVRDVYASKDLDGDGRLSREEYFGPHLGGKWESNARKEAVLHDVDGDGYLTLLEFVRTPQVDPTPDQMFAVLDRDGDERLRVEELADRGPRAKDPAARLQMEELKMRLEDAFRISDQDKDQSLTRDEYTDPDTGVDAALSRASQQTERSRTTTTSQQPATETWSWRFVGLVFFNVLLLGGVAWMVLRRA